VRKYLFACADILGLAQKYFGLRGNILACAEIFSLPAEIYSLPAENYMLRGNIFKSRANFLFVLVVKAGSKGKECFRRPLSLQQNLIPGLARFSRAPLARFLVVHVLGSIWCWSSSGCHVGVGFGRG
jgi:hypothetical protein